MPLMTERWRSEAETPRAVESFRQTFGRIALHVAGASIAAMPVAAAYGITHAEVHDEIGALPVTITAQPGHSTLDLGPFGSLQDERVARFGVGAAIKLDGPPASFSELAIEDPRTLAEPFVGIYQDPASVKAGYADALTRSFHHETLEAWGISAAALLGMSLLISGRHDFRSKSLAFTTIGSAGLLSSLAAVYTLAEWRSDHTMPEQTYAVQGIETSWLNGVTADNPLLAHAGKGAIDILQKLKEREAAKSEAFLTTAHTDIDSLVAAGAFTPPAEDETLVLALADLHSNLAMIDLYQHLVDTINHTYGKDTLRLTVLAGDQTYGSASEKAAVDEIGDISQEVYAISGNHDSKITEDNHRAADIHLLEGKTATSHQNVRLLGVADPSLTKLSALLSFGENTSRHGDNMSQAEAGALLKAEATKTQPTIIAMHEAYQLAPFIDKDDISKTTMEKWFKDEQSVIEIPSSVLLYGHWHGDTRYVAVPQPDGHTAIVVELGTAGGASGQMSPTTASLPWTVPAQRASAMLLTLNTESQLVTRMQEVITKETGHIMFQPAQTISQPAAASDKASRKATIARKASKEG